MDIKVIKVTEKRPKPDPDNLGFGNIFTDHMFQMDYTEGKGWHDPCILPYQDLVLPPCTAVFHYSQATFEGLKAYRNGDDVFLFRPEKNFARLNSSNERLALPLLDEEFCLKALKELLLLEKDWIPDKEGTSLYIRPFVIATENILGVHPSRTCKFLIILSPSGMYYKEGMNPVKIYVEDEYVRAVKGGMGFAKTGGNYAASYIAQGMAQKKGYTQVLWLDGLHHKYIEEVGSTNVFFKIGDEVVTPELNGSILSGITRASTIELLKSWGMTVSERQISIDELYDAYDAGRLEEAFATGTAAVISPIGELGWRGRDIIVGDNKIGPVTAKIYEALIGIQYGKSVDPFGWVVKL